MTSLSISRQSTNSQLNKTSCGQCKKSYDTNTYKPFCLMPCGCNFCHKCVSSLETYQCPKCKEKFNQYIPDYGLLDVIKGLDNMKINIKTISNHNTSVDSSSSESYCKVNNSDNYDSNLNSKELKNSINRQDRKSLLKPEVINLIMYGTTEQQLMGTQVVRKILSIESLPTENIDEIIDAGLVPKLIEFLDSKNSELQFESTWALTNIASGNSNQTKYVVEQGALPHLIKLLDSKNPDVREQSIWALGNIAGDGAKYRDLLLDIGFLSPLIRLLLDENERISLKQNGAWCLSNLCRGKNPLVDLNKIEPAFDVISKILSNYTNNTNIISDTCWALSYLSDGANERIQQVIEKIDLKALVKLLKSESSSILTPVIRTIGNIVSGDDLQTQAILDCDLLPNLNELYNHSKASIRKEINWSLSNIAAGNKEQIQKLIDHNFFPKIIQTCQQDIHTVKKEACWTVSNAICGASKEQIIYLITKCNIVSAIESLLKSDDDKIILLALESVKNLYQNEKFDNDYMILIESSVNKTEIKSIIENLTMSNNEKIYKLASELVSEQFFIDDSDDVN